MDCCIIINSKSKNLVEYYKQFRIKILIYEKTLSFFNKLYKYKHFMLIKDNILIYNWEKIEDRNKQIYFLFNKYKRKNHIYSFKIFNSKDKIYLINYKIEKEIIINYFDNNNLIKSKNIDKIIGVNIFNNINNHLININNDNLCILFLNQLDNNIFLKRIYQIKKKYDKKIFIFCYYGLNCPFGKIENNDLDVIYVNDNNLLYYIEKLNISKLYLLYLPFVYIKNKDNFDKIMEKKNIKKYIYIAGIITHMYEYVEKYNFNSIITNGKLIKYVYKKKHNNNKIIDLFFINKINLELFLKRDKLIKNKLSKNFSFIGRFCQEKNIIFLIQCFKLLINEKFDIKLYLIGNGPELTKINNFIKVNKLEKNIFILGWLDHNELIEKIQFYDIDFNILTSINEGRPNIIYELMALGIPTICSNIFFKEDILINKYNIIYFNLKNYEQIITSKIYNNPKELYIEINKYINHNIKNFISIFKEIYNDIKMIKQISENGFETIKRILKKNETINYNEIFT